MAMFSVLILVTVVFIAYRTMMNAFLAVQTFVLPINNYDPISIKGFDVPQIHTQKSIQGFIADIKVRMFSGSLPPTK